MARRSLLEIADERALALDELGDRIGGEVAVNPLAPKPTAVHLATIEVLSSLLDLASSASPGEEVPSELRMLLRFVQRLKPMMLEGVAKQPEAQIKVFMRKLSESIQTILDAPESTEQTGSHDAAVGAADGTAAVGADIATPAG